MEKKSKYDTNPLPEDVLREAEEVFGQNDTPNEAQTRAYAPKPQTNPNPDAGEVPTRNFQEKYAEPYHSVFDSQFQREPQVNQPISKQYSQVKSERYKAEKLPITSRTVEGLNLPEGVVMIAPYLPFTLGGIAALIFLFLTPRHETRVRFHAAQGLALHIAVFAISTLLGIIATIAHIATGSVLFTVASTIFFIISIIRVAQGEPHHIQALDDATNWLNEKISPRR